MPEYRYLGRSGLKVPRLSLGTMMFGGQTDAGQARKRGVDWRLSAISP